MDTSITPVDVMKRYGLVPVIVLERREDARPLAECLIEADLPLAEVTLRTDESLEALRVMSEFAELTVGAGTVIEAGLADQAAQAGAQFLVSPGLNPATVARAQELNLPMVPGVSNASLVEQAREMGLRHLKFFPAERLGGPGMVSTLASVYPDVAFMPTGGIGPANLADYAALGSVFACGGSWIVNRTLISGGKWEEMRRLIADARAIIEGARR